MKIEAKMNYCAKIVFLLFNNNFKTTYAACVALPEVASGARKSCPSAMAQRIASQIINDD
jgi:hypothetical protein